MLDDSPLFSFWRLAPPDLRRQIGVYPENITTFLYFVPDGRSFLVISPTGYEIEDSSITTYADEILTSYLRKEYVDI